MGYKAIGIKSGLIIIFLIIINNEKKNSFHGYI